mmetsp:Transcript_17274/g.30416  ORF Transcript_17274/g.30416 Transcript_17274/m.30416 type:complete len:94 (-) Transcript_17274:4274-4555(-)
MQLCEQRRRREHLVNSRQSPSISTMGLMFGKNRMIPDSLGISQLAWSIPSLNAFHYVRSQVSNMNSKSALCKSRSRSRQGHFYASFEHLSSSS